MCGSCQQAFVSVNALTMSFVSRACNCGQVLRCILLLADWAFCLGRIRLYPSHPGYSSNRAAHRCPCTLLRKSGQSTHADRLLGVDHRRHPESSLFHAIRTAPYDRVTSRIILLQTYSQAPQETATSNRHQSRGTCALLTPLHVNRKLQV